MRRTTIEKVAYEHGFDPNHVERIMKEQEEKTGEKFDKKKLIRFLEWIEEESEKRQAEEEAEAEAALHH